MHRAILLLSIMGTQSIVANGQAEEKASPDRPPPASPFALKNFDGRMAPLKKYRGKIIVINFWATWCAPCLAEIPEFIRLQRNYRNQGLQVIGVTYPPVSRARVRWLAVKSRINYPLLFGNRRLPLNSACSFQVMPPFSRASPSQRKDVGETSLKLQRIFCPLNSPS
jgi:thiol-disulfide isomerase/thioredoxin